MINKFIKNYNIFFKIFILNFLITILLSSIYIYSSKETITYNNFYFIIFAVISNTSILYIPLMILVSFIFFIKNNIARSTIISLIFTLFHIAIFADATIYRLYKFHFNSMVFNLITTEGAFDSVHLGFGTIFTTILLILLLFTILYFATYYILTKPEKFNISKKYKFVLSLLILIFIISDKAVYAYSDLTNNYEILRYSKLFPLYQPLTIKRFAEKFFNYKVDREEIIKINSNNSSLKYPLKPLNTQIQKKYNVLFLVIDSWRYDMLDSLVCPNIYQFSKKAIILNNHYSGGNATRFGIFSLFYGVDGTYWHQFLAERKGAAFFDILLANQYDFLIGSSTRLTYPEFRKTAFVKLSNSIHDNLDGDEAKDKDPKLAQLLLNFLDKRDKTKPFFSFLFFDAPHGPYSYPQEFDKFKPSRTEINFITMNKNQVHAIKNTYKNAILFDDHLVGEILKKLEKDKLLENTIIVITGDHGEEFYESGYSGHTSAFTKQQAKVASILYLPNQKHAIIDYMTNHFDYIPTILSYMGSKADFSSFTEGENIFAKTKKYSICSGWDKAAIIMDDYTIVFSTETYNAANFEIRNSNNYQIVNDIKPVIKNKMTIINEVIKNLSKFKN